MHLINHRDCEDLWIKLGCNNSESLLVCVLYRHQKSKTDNFTEKLQSSLEKVDEENFNWFILGDVNIDITKDKLSNKTRNYLNMLNCNAFHSLIDKPTKVTATSQTVIDRVYTSVDLL